MAENKKSKRGLASADEATRKRVASLGGHARQESNKSQSSSSSRGKGNER